MNFQEPEVVDIGVVEEQVELLDFFYCDYAEYVLWPFTSRPEWPVYICDANE